MTSERHSVRSPVHHDNPDCNTGRAVEPVNRRPDRESKPLWAECARLDTKAHALPRGTDGGLTSAPPRPWLTLDGGMSAPTR